MTPEVLRDQRKVMIVDDDDDAREIFGLGLTEGAGWSVVYASSGLEALEVFQRERPDVVLMDVMMPGIDGFTTMTRLRALPTGTDVPVIFITAGAGPDEHRRVRELGAHGVIDKPLDPWALAGHVRRLLAGGRGGVR